MDIALWMVQVLLAVAFGMSGLMKLVVAREQAMERQAWVEDVPQDRIRVIGIVEIVCASAMLLPGLLDIGTYLTASAAVVLAIIMVGAMVLHFRRSEQGLIVVNLVLMAAALFVAWGRFGDYPL